EKRKLSTDQWQSVGMIHLVITLIWIWGHSEGRQHEMLDNYMHLVTAIYIANLHSTSWELVSHYTEHFKCYLSGVLDLYKEAKLQPVHHACLHFERLLVGLGPVHSWRAWAFKHFNYRPQRTKTNMHFG
ncbi:hypothetical protein M404DRAFT_104897, partial [Pisolithus tinctorius Marx 270]